MSRIKRDLMGTGLRYPFTPSRTSGVQMNSELDRINQSLFILFETQKGSRMMQVQYGSDLEKYRFDPFDEILVDKLDYEIRNCISIWEPRIILDDIEYKTTAADKDAHTLYISIDYHVINTDVKGNYVYPFRTGTMETVHRNGMEVTI